jgi:predicted lysophospholipase L1 biosynthesis ABC-type transport system permease subunit
VANRLPASLSAAVPAGRASMAEDVLHAADLGLDFVTGLTVAMSWFIVVNAMLMNVTERRRGLALVRLLGGTARQLRRTVMAEAVILGGVGAVVGAGLGLLAARPIAGGIAAALNAPLTEFTFDPRIVLVSMLMGPARGRPRGAARRHSPGTTSAGERCLDTVSARGDFAVVHRSTDSFGGAF